MLIDLILSIISSACLFIILKKFSDWKVVTVHGILVNYFVASLLSYSFSDMSFQESRLHFFEIWPYPIGIGLLFILVFVLTGKTAQVCGIAASSIASKMSMVIPIGLGIILYNESFGLQKALGVALALPAVILAGSQNNNVNTSGFRSGLIWLPILLFLGAGLVDTSIKFAQHALMDDKNNYLIISLIFASAGSFGLIKLAYDLFSGGERFSIRSLLGGILLGLVNFMSLYFLVRCLDRPGVESSFVFAVVNVGVVMASFLAGVLLFKEKPDFKKTAGLLLALAAIVVLTV
ncbi:MAG: EamA/RhaT family transporter [Bacteroidota bacterium]|jgi:drug/metabolite transporter (DMT)-like permease